MAIMFYVVSRALCSVNPAASECIQTQTSFLYSNSVTATRSGVGMAVTPGRGEEEGRVRRRRG